MTTIKELLENGTLTLDTVVVGDITKQMTGDRCLAAVSSELWADFSEINVDWPKQCLGPCLPCVPMSCLYGHRENAEKVMKERSKR